MIIRLPATEARTRSAGQQRYPGKHLAIDGSLSAAHAPTALRSSYLPVPYRSNAVLRRVMTRTAARRTRLLKARLAPARVLK